MNSSFITSRLDIAFTTQTVCAYKRMCVRVCVSLFVCVGVCVIKEVNI